MGLAATPDSPNSVGESSSRADFLLDANRHVFRLENVDKATGIGSVVVDGTVSGEKASLLFEKDGVVFAMGGNDSWKFWRDGKWVVSGRPGGAPELRAAAAQLPPSGAIGTKIRASVNGSMVPPDANVTDEEGHEFFLRDIDAAGVGTIEVDGNPTEEKASLLFVHDGLVFATLDREAWLLWRNGKWVTSGKPADLPDGAASAAPKKETVPPTTAISTGANIKTVPPEAAVSDADGNSFSLTKIDPVTVTGIVSINGVPTGHAASLLIASKGRVFAVTTGGSASFYRDRTWVTSGLPADAPQAPRPADPKPSNSLAQALPVGMPVAPNAAPSGSYVPLVVKMPPATPAPIPTPPPHGMWVTLTFADGRSFTFSQDTAIDRGAYEGEYVHVRSFEARNPDLPMWTVFFRIDERGSKPRREAIFEYGDIWASPAEAVHIMKPYLATIGDGGSVLGTVVVPYHWWRARWRWQEWPRPVARTPAELMAKGWVPRLGTTASIGVPAAFKPETYVEPMDWAGLNTAMAAVGDREEIGEVTEAQARYLVMQDPVALSSLIAQAEAAGTMPDHVRDPHTGGQVDLLQYPELTVLSHQPGSPELQDAPNPAPAPNQAGATGIGGAPFDFRYFRLDVNHTPAVAAVPFMLTDDPYYLEELENQGLWGVAWTDHYRSRQGVPYLVFPLEDRGWAWSMRNLFQLATLAPVSAPVWLKSRPYWQTMVDQNGTWMDRYIVSPAIVHRVLHAFPRSDSAQSFMRSFVICAIAQFVQSGHPEWLERLRWVGQQSIQMVDGADGWFREFPAPYDFAYSDRSDDRLFQLLVPDTSEDSTTFHHWGEVWAYMVAQRIRNGVPPGENWNTSSWDGHTLMNPPQNSFNYVVNLRAALVSMVNSGISAALPGVSYLDDELPKALANEHAWGGYRWAFVTGPQQTRDFGTNR